MSQQKESVLDRLIRAAVAGDTSDRDDFVASNMPSPWMYPDSIYMTLGTPQSNASIGAALNSLPNPINTTGKENKIPTLSNPKQEKTEAESSANISIETISDNLRRMLGINTEVNDISDINKMYKKYVNDNSMDDIMKDLKRICSEFGFMDKVPKVPNTKEVSTPANEKPSETVQPVQPANPTQPRTEEKHTGTDYRLPQFVCKDESRPRKWRPSSLGKRDREQSSPYNRPKVELDKTNPGPSFTFTVQKSPETSIAPVEATKTAKYTAKDLREIALAKRYDLDGLFEQYQKKIEDKLLQKALDGAMECPFEFPPLEKFQPGFTAEMRTKLIQRIREYLKENKYVVDFAGDTLIVSWE